MKLQAKSRLLADDNSDKRRSRELDDALDRVEKQIDQTRKGLPSATNTTKVSEQNQITKRRQILDSEQTKQDIKEQQLRLKKD